MKNRCKFGLCLSLKELILFCGEESVLRTNSCTGVTGDHNQDGLRYTDCRVVALEHLRISAFNSIVR